MEMKQTNIRFEEGLDYGFVRSNSPEVVRDIYGLSKENRDVVILDIDLFADRIKARVPLSMIEQGLLFKDDKGIRKMAISGGNGTVHINH